jgi:hypothetical protein
MTALFVILVAVAVVLLGWVLLRVGRQIAIGLLALGGIVAIAAIAVAMFAQANATRTAVGLAQSSRWPGLATVALCGVGLLVLALASGIAYLAARWALRERLLRHELERNIGTLGSGGRDHRGRHLPRDVGYYPPVYPAIYDLDEVEAPDEVDEPLWWVPSEWWPDAEV